MAETMMATHGAAGHVDDPTKRDFLKLVAGAGAAVGVGAIAWPLIDSMNPSKDVLAVSTTEVDLTPITAGMGDHRALARQAGVRAPPHPGGDQGSRGRQDVRS